MKKLTSLAALTITLAFTSAAAAQDLSPEVNYDFEDHAVDGGYDSPLGDLIHSRTRAGRVSLVRPRRHFVPELLKTVENI